MPLRRDGVGSRRGPVLKGRVGLSDIEGTHNVEPLMHHTPDTLRQQLMASDPMQRAMALHALEIEVERCAASSRAALRHEAERFAARGIPYYALHDRHFQDWVGKAVSYWERLHDAA